MHLELFKALRSLKLSEDQATAVVQSLEAHVVKVTSEAIRRVEAQNQGIEAKLDALRANLTFTTILLGIIGLAIAAGPIVAKFIP